MGVMTIEGVVDQGRIRLKTNVRLPENTKVYVVVPDLQIERVAELPSPCLAHPEEMDEFVLQVLEERSGVGL